MARLGSSLRIPVPMLVRESGSLGTDANLSYSFMHLFLHLSMCAIRVAISTLRLTELAVRHRALRRIPVWPLQVSSTAGRGGGHSDTGALQCYRGWDRCQRVRMRYML